MVLCRGLASSRVLSSSSSLTWTEKPTKTPAAMRPVAAGGILKEGPITQLEIAGYGCRREFVGQQTYLTRSSSVKCGSFGLSAASFKTSNGRSLNGSTWRSNGKTELLKAVADDGDAASIAKEADSVLDDLEPSSAYTQWDSLTSRFADSSTAAFILLQLPQIILNTQNLLSNNPGALFAIPWKGYLTGLLGNLSLLSYFASKKERGAMVVQAIGVITCLMVLSQLAVAGAMPSTAFTITASVSVIGLTLNLLNYQNKLNQELWRFWGEAISIGGVTVLPQVMWSTFEPYLPPNFLPAAIFGSLAMTIIVLARLGKLPPKAKSAMGGVSAWTATLLFMWPPVAQWWQNYLYPANIKGLSVFTVLLAMFGNALLLPRALFTRDLMWFTGSSWGSILQGWGILLTMYLVQATSDLTFWGVSAVLFLWLSNMLWQDSKAYDLNSPLEPLVELVSGKKLS